MFCPSENCCLAHAYCPLNYGKLNGNVLRAIGEKQPNSIKKPAKVLNDVLAMLNVFATKVKIEIKAVHTSNTEIHSELDDIREAMGFMTKRFEEFKKYR